jgi:photosystem II stability/assembly factor-like uncharacterized protein
MKKRTVLMLLVNLLTGSLFAQTAGRKDLIFNLPPSVSVPRWVNLIDWAHPNIYKIDSTIEACEERDMHAKKAKKEENDEEPYEMAYKRWRKKIEPFIQANGAVVEQSGYYNRLLQTAIDAQSKTKQQAAGARIAGSANWTILGPVETYDDKKTKIPWQVNVYSLAIAPSDPNVLYAGAETGAIYRTADKGLHWTSISDNLPPFTATAIAVDPANANTVYATGNGGQLIKSLNAGASWTFLTAYQGGGSEKIAISKTTGAILVAGNTGVYYSNNGGSSWQLAGGSSASPVYDVEFNATNPNIVYAVGAQANAGKAITIFRSVNGGVSFTAVNAAVLNNVHCNGARFGVTPANGNTVYCINLDDAAPRLFKSTNGGISWSLTVTGKTPALDLDNWQGFYDLDLMVSPTNENQVILGTRYAVKSVDGGFNFTRLSDNPFPLHADIQCMRSTGNDAWITTDGGVSYSPDFFTNTSNWSARNNGITGSELWGFGQGWDQDIVVGGRYHNGDMTVFENYGAGNSLYLGWAEAATGHVFHGQKNMVGFSDAGTMQIPSSLPGNIMGALISNTLWPQDDWYGTLSSKLMIDPRYSNIFYVGRDNTLWKSVNYGSSYAALHDFGSKVWRFDIARSNPNVIYVCTQAAVYKTTDGGASWITLSLPAGVDYRYYNADISVDQLDANVVFLCMAQGESGNKVFKSTNGGTAWTNYTGSLTDAPIAYITSQAGANGGVYAITNQAPAKVYYRDNTMPDWIDYSNGLPQNFSCSQGGIIFYRDSKLRVAGNRGVWESPLYSTGAPVAQPMADKQFISCSRDTVSFIDYSNVNYAGAQWKWTFPGASYVSSTNSREVKVLYPSPGAYSVSLQVTDAAGNKHTSTVNQMITFTQDNCSPDTVAGKCLKMDGSYNSINLGKVNINSNNFSISCWIKPDGLQNALTQLLAHDAYPGSSSWFGLGFTWQGGASNLELGYTDKIVTWGNASGLIADNATWNFVVLTYSPTGVKIYLNGVPATVNNGPMPVMDLSQSPFYISRDLHGQGAAYHGAIDEIKFYNYALTQNEVREKMHLIQSNGYDSDAGIVQDVAGLYQALVPANLLTPSTAPVATGKVFRKPDVNSGGRHSFPGTGIDLFLKNGATLPNGELVAFHLYSGPDQKPDTLSLVPRSHYFIINNYGTQKTFTAPDSIRFSGLDVEALGATDFRLYKRPFGAWGPTWSTDVRRSTGFTYALRNSTITFSAGNNITGFGQLAITAPPINQLLSLNDTSRVKNKQHNKVAFAMKFFPNPNKGWGYLSITSPKTKGPVLVTLQDVNGNIVYRTAEQLSGGDKTSLLLVFNALPSGAYILNIRFNTGEVLTKKLVIVK